MIIIKELFYLIFDKNKFISFSDELYKENIKEFWEIIIIIDKYCEDNKIDYLLILDQYQEKTDKNKQIKSLKTKKIFLISIINDTDIKKNLISTIKNDYSTDLINYKYIISLFDKEEIIPFIKIEKNKSDKIMKILGLFNFLSFYLFLLEHIYNWNVLNFINDQFYSILKKLSVFLDISDIKVMSSLISYGKINSSYNIIKKTIDLKYFLNNINDIHSNLLLMN